MFSFFLQPPASTFSVSIFDSSNSLSYFMSPMSLSKLVPLQLMSSVSFNTESSVKSMCCRQYFPPFFIWLLNTGECVHTCGSFHAKTTTFQKSWQVTPSDFAHIHTVCSSIGRMNTQKKSVAYSLRF